MVQNQAGTTDTALTPYRMCTRCVMDTSDPAITFDEQGVCNHCKRYYLRVERGVFRGEEGRAKIQRLAARVKDEGAGQEYDCIVGLSGGVDSSYVVHVVKELGLRPLAVHLDNGWNSELAVDNISQLVRTLDLDLYTEVLDWEMFRDLQLSFLRAGVANCEIPTDHAIGATLYSVAREQGVNYIISGNNYLTEGILPFSFGYSNADWRHIKGIHRRFGSKSLSQYPHTSALGWVLNLFVRRIERISILNYMDYDKQEAKRLLMERYGWRDYGGKHYESVFTRFFQGYILPEKFGIDKRRAHLSALVCAGQMHRDEALTELEQPPYPPAQASEDRAYVIKKFGLTEEEFDRIMDSPPVPFSEYPNNHLWFEKARGIARFLRDRLSTV